MKYVKPLLLASVISSLTIANANELNTVIDKSAAINESAKTSQQKIDSITDSMQSRLNKFKTLNKEIDGLTVYNAQLTKQINNQLQEMDAINSSMDQVSVIERQITPLMLNMITGLEQFVALDVPFLPEERVQRVETLKDLLERADVTSSEKFRRVLEAYQVEMDYGRTIEAYTALLEVQGQQREVDFLRIGRLELLYVTKDGKFAGSWDNENKQFVELPESTISQINKGLRIARKQLAPDMLTLPVQAAK
ncbi:TonB system biopolymer transport component; Chromosome segregation ATPase [Pseudoalteromonas luteoviolacea B = ATCC 29581]|nr:TonB system biopolymer transport component; Chromosome segregation ATPase [Pseudoalteromonas luteoviolacea B = ATCC 29581]